MSKKINPTSLRLGTQLYWNQIFQNYGFKKSTETICMLIKINQALTNLPFFLNIIKTVVLPKKQKTFIFIHTLNPKQIDQFQKLVPLFWTTNYIYNSLCFSISARLLTYYARFLFNNHIPLKKILVMLEMALTKNLKKSKLVNTKFGFRLFYLKGFRLSISGRFETTSTQMARTLTQTVGTLPLGKLENYVEFSSTPIFFKLGKCNLKIWLFYSAIEHAIST